MELISMIVLRSVLINTKRLKAKIDTKHIYGGSKVVFRHVRNDGGSGFGNVINEGCERRHYVQGQVGYSF